ncbi:NAD+ synthase [Candidatus Poribacteria bacterium]|nr:NAD+ synthase [Candidatus Poribacteria bacterium]
MRRLRIAMAQINTSVGDLIGNTRKILEFMKRAKSIGAELITFPELSITGYPPEDLLLKPTFIDANLSCLQKIVAASEAITVVVGFVDAGDDIYNAAAIIHNQKLEDVYHKMFLPNYGVFDENRYFQAGMEPLVFTLNGVTIGVNICEDIWYPQGPMNVEALAGGAEMMVNISASPYHAGKGEFRKRMLATRAADNVVIVAFNNLVGGQDELIFDGNGMIFSQNGELIIQGKQFEEDLIVADLDIDAVFRRRLHDPRHRKEKLASMIAGTTVKKIELPFPPFPPRQQGGREAEGQRKVDVNRDKPSLPISQISSMSHFEEIYHALVLGTRDYVRKNGFEKVVIGLSGGIDSSLTATIAVDALGKENVIGVTMPSQYSSQETKSDAQRLADNLGIKLITIPIIDVFESYLNLFSEVFHGLERNITEENLQARIRGNILMALSNKFGWLVLTTGNKSEMSVGYCTLYGDMAGGFAVIKDVPKILVYKLSEYRNSIAEIGAGVSDSLIPQSVIERAPSAELRPNQKDVDSLPPYEILDPILQAYVEEDRSFGEIVQMGFDEAIVKRVILLVDRNEYKRRQGPPGIKITPRAFGKDRRLPITNQNTSLIRET